MNDPDPDNDPRPMSDGLDHDAIFAEIVAHLNDEGVELERLGGPRIEDAPTANLASESKPGDEATTEAAESDEAKTEATETDEPPAYADPQVPPPTGEPLPPTPPPHPQALPAPQVWRAHEVDHDHDDDEHFEPPPVAPLPVGDLQFWAIIAGMGGGPLLLLYLVLFNREAGSYWILAAIAMSVGGFALLVARLPGNQGDDDGARL